MSKYRHKYRVSACINLLCFKHINTLLIELTEFEKKKIEVFEPPKQLGLPEVNEIVKPSKQPNTTPKTTKKTPTNQETEEKSSTGSKSGSLPKPTAASEQESEPEAEPEPEPEPESSSSSVSNDDEEPKPEAETRATIKPQTIKPSGSKTSSEFVSPTIEPEVTTAADIGIFDTTPSSMLFDETKQVMQLSYWTVLDYVLSQLTIYPTSRKTKKRIKMIKSHRRRRNLQKIKKTKIILPLS